MLDILDNDNEFKIKNRMTSNEAFQAIVILLRTDSPFAETATSLSEYVGGNSDDSAVAVRLKEVEKILQSEYNVKSLTIESIDFIEGDGVYEITLYLTYNDGSVEKGVVKA